MAEKKAEAKPETQATPAAEAAPRRKKINELSLADIDARLAECKDKQGDLFSKYARQLLARKKALTS